jgi:aspartyl-tRNA(Asn)/glutamyl-tRNA(Gln) amidotransferase subunit C
MAITPEKAVAISKLASIDILEEEVQALAGELDYIINWINQLNELDVSHIDLRKLTSKSMPERDDIVNEVPMCEAVLHNAPSRVETWFAVPKVIE